MRYVVLSHEFAPAINGSAKTGTAMARALQQAGHNVTVFTRTYEGPPGDETFEGMLVRRFRPRRFRWWHMPHPPYRRSLRRANADVLLLLHQDTWMSNQIVDLWPRLRAVRVYFPIEFDAERGKASRSRATHRLWTRAFQNPLLRSSHAVVAVTREEAERLRAFGGSSISVHFLPLGVDETAFEEPLGPTGAAPSVPYVLHVSSRAKNKRRDLAVRIAQRMGGEVPWVFVGPGSEDVDAAMARGVGTVTAAQLRAWYRGAVVHVTTSAAEGFGHTLLESLAQGTPFVSHRLGVAPELADVGGGLLVEEGPDAEPSRLVEAFAATVRSAMQREWRRERLRAIAREYRWADLVTRLDALVTEARR